MSFDVRLPPPSEAAGSGRGTRPREATATRGSGSGARASATRSSGDVAGGTAHSATANVATAKSATAASTKARSHTSTNHVITIRPAVRQPLSAVPGGDESAPSKLGAVVNLPEKFCACCRGPHRRGSKPLAKLTVEQRARLKAGPIPEFARLYASSELPAEKNSGSFGGAEQIRWRQQGWPSSGFDFSKWLPIFVEGARVTAEPQRMIAIEGTKEILKSTPSSQILPLLPSLVPPLRAALNTANPPAVAAALEMLRTLLEEHKDAVDVLIDCDGFRRLLPTPNTLSACPDLVRVGYRTKIVGGEKKRLDVIIDEVLRLMADAGGARGLRLIKSYIPTFDPERPKMGSDERWGRRTAKRDGLR
jgi:hypothetical protein